MPSQAKVSPKERLRRQLKENEGIKKVAIVALNGSEAITSSDGKTKVINNLYLQKADGSYHVRVTERRSKNVLVMKWRSL